MDIKVSEESSHFAILILAKIKILGNQKRFSCSLTFGTRQTTVSEICVIEALC
jgi:hypothetical protein